MWLFEINYRYRYRYLYIDHLVTKRHKMQEKVVTPQSKKVVTLSIVFICVYRYFERRKLFIVSSAMRKWKVWKIGCF